MTKIAASPTSLASASAPKAVSPAESGAGPRRDPPPKSETEADLRLVIEEDETTGSFVYKTLDRRTGEVVQQLPREEVLRLKDNPRYEPGHVVDAKR